MIFYFSGTGNSYATAVQLEKRLNETILNITDCIQKEKYRFSPVQEETVGFVCPVYYGGLPSIVCDFLEKIEFDNKPEYVFALAECFERCWGRRGVSFLHIGR